MKTNCMTTLGTGAIMALIALGSQAAPFAYIPNNYYNIRNVTVVDLATNKSVAAIPTDGQPYGIAIKSDGSRGYVTNESTGNVTVFDTETNTVVRHITVGSNPYGIALKPDGTRAYVANYYSNNVSVLNTQNNTYITDIALSNAGNTPRPVGIAVNPGGTRAYVANSNTDNVSVIDLSTNQVDGNAISAGDGPVSVALKPDGTRLYVVNQNSDSVSVINTATNLKIVDVGVGDNPFAIAINGTGTRAYVTNRYGRSVTVLDITTDAINVIGTISLNFGYYDAYGIALNPASTRAYVTGGNSNTVAVINTGNNSVITYLSGFNNPIALGNFIGPAPAPATTARLSLSSAGRQGNGDAFNAAVSADGRYVVFASTAGNLVTGDTNEASDIFLRDRVTKRTTRISRGVGGVQANGDSFKPVISADGRYTAYESYASNLVAGDTNNTSDIFRYDRLSGATLRLSIASGAAGAQSNGDSTHAAISADGSHVAFASEATNLVLGDTNARWDAFVRDIGANTTTRVSVTTPGVQGNGDSVDPIISGNDRFVAFVSNATNLVTGDTNSRYDIFVRDRVAPATTRVSIATGAAGAQANRDSWQPYISDDGRYVVFASDATNLVAGDTNGFSDIFLRDRTTNVTTRLSVDSLGLQSDNHSYNPRITNDGRYGVFESYGALVATDYNGAADIYLRDRTANKTQLLSVSTGSILGDFDSLWPVMSSDGRYVIFESIATNLVGGDNNYAGDIFARDRGIGTSPIYPLSIIKEAPADQ